MEFLRSKKPQLSLDMAPLIDIVFQLLIFFMLTSSFLNPALRLDLPKAVQTQVREREIHIISVDKEGQIFINNRSVKMEAFQSALSRELEKDPKKSIHIRGDQEMPYKYFVSIMDMARQAGATQINIVHEAKR